jgi:hypothetical protein
VQLERLAPNGVNVIAIKNPSNNYVLYQIVNNSYFITLLRKRKTQMNHPIQSKSRINYETGEILDRCPRCNNLYFYNKKTKEIHYAMCNSYSCPYCAPVRLRRLRNAIHNVLSNHQHIRMFTFTIRNSQDFDKRLFIRLFRECFRRFLNSIRRCSKLSAAQRNFDYIRVSELTKKGFIHYHVFIFEYLPKQIVYRLWNKCIKLVFKSSKQSGWIDISHSFNASGAANYVSKYVSKSAGSVELRYNKYSHSRKLVLFKKHVKNPDWEFLNFRRRRSYLSYIASLSRLDFQIQLLYFDLYIDHTPPVPDDPRLFEIEKVVFPEFLAQSN